MFPNHMKGHMTSSHIPIYKKNCRNAIWEPYNHHEDFDSSFLYELSVYKWKIKTVKCYVNRVFQKVSTLSHQLDTSSHFL